MDFNLPLSPLGEYVCDSTLNLYDSPQCQSLATQAHRGRQLKILTPLQAHLSTIEVELCEDRYRGWLSSSALSHLRPAPQAYQAVTLNRQVIETKLPQIIQFAQTAMKTPNLYVWGGTVAPNYDCSGLIQASFAQFGIWLPRDSYQQEAFTRSIIEAELEAGDLIFFGETKVNHVALYLGNRAYIHSSGRDLGNNGIGINTLPPASDPVSQNYAQILWGFGRVEESFDPSGSSNTKF